MATGRAVTVNELAETIGGVLGRDVAKEYLPERAGDVRDSWADVARADELLGWRARIGLEEGLRIVADTFLERVA